MEKPRRSVILRLLVFIVLAGGAGAGTFYGTRGFAESKMSGPRAAEKEALSTGWSAKALDSLHDRLMEKSSSPAGTPPSQISTEEKALLATIAAEFDGLKRENVESSKRAEKAHGELERWQFGWYAAIGLAGLLAGMIGWKLSGMGSG